MGRRGGYESEVKAQVRHEEEGERTSQEECGEMKRETKTMHEENDVSNRHMTWWRTFGGSVTADHTCGRREAVDGRRAARRAAEQARDDGRVEETQSLAEVAEGEKW